MAASRADLQWCATEMEEHGAATRLAQNVAAAACHWAADASSALHSQSAKAHVADGAQGGYTMDNQSELAAGDGERDMIGEGKATIEELSMSGKHEGYTMSKQSEAVAAAAEVQGYTMVKQSEAATAGTRGGEKPEATALVVADASCRGRGPGNGMDTDRFNRNVNRASNLSEARAV